MKDMGGLNQSTINGRMGALRGIKAREIRRVMADLKAREVSELEREGRFRCLPEEGRAISLQLCLETRRKEAKHLPGRTPPCGVGSTGQSVAQSPFAKL
jgi:hypothetical protein